MSEPKYVFDTNVFIILKNNYPSDISIFTPLWEKIETMFKDGIIISSEEVIEEIERGNDSLIDWVKIRKNFFYKSDEPLQQNVREILQRFGALVTKPKKPSGADPFVIALARQMNCTVVTEEKRDGNDINPKIPFICDYYNIQCIKFVDFLRDNDF